MLTNRAFFVLHFQDCSVHSSHKHCCSTRTPLCDFGKLKKKFNPAYFLHILHFTILLFNHVDSNFRIKKCLTTYMNITIEFLLNYYELKWICAYCIGWSAKIWWPTIHLVCFFFILIYFHNFYILVCTINYLCELCVGQESIRTWIWFIIRPIASLLIQFLKSSLSFE